MPQDRPNSGSKTVGRKRKDSDESVTGSGVSVNFRAAPDLYARLRFVADTLGLDISNLVRLLLNENLFVYEERARKIIEQRERPS